MAIFKIKKDNNLVVLIAGLGLFFSLLLYVIYPPLREAVGIYGAISLVGLFFYTNPAFQKYLVGIPRKRMFSTLLIGVVLGLGFVILPKIIPGMSIGIPILPASVESNLKWVIICLFAPFIEEIGTRGALLGFVRYLRRKRGVSNAETWVAIFVQAIFFMLLHALAYSAGWYTAPDWLGVFGNFGAVASSLIAAGLFGVIMGYVVTRKKNTNSLLVSIIAHYAVNQILFLNLVVGKVFI